jgi:phosphoglycolate phosphatase
MYDLILFDFDGTLADSSSWFVATLPELARVHRFRMPSEAEIAMLRGRSTRDVVKAMGISPWKLPAIARDLRSRAERNVHAIELFDGIEALLDALHESGATGGVVSSNSERVARQVLGRHATTIHHYACGASLFGKARLLSRLTRAAGKSPSRSLYVGDELRDIAAARAARLAAGAVEWGYSTQEALADARPDHLFEAPHDISGCVQFPGTPAP